MKVFMKTIKFWLKKREKYKEIFQYLTGTIG